MLAVKVVETKDHLKSAINLVNQKVRMQHLVEFQLLEFVILYKAAAQPSPFVRTYFIQLSVRPRFLRRPPLCDEQQYTNSCQGIVFVKLENHAKIFCKKDTCLQIDIHSKSFCKFACAFLSSFENTYVHKYWPYVFEHLSKSWNLLN